MRDLASLVRHRVGLPLILGCVWVGAAGAAEPVPFNRDIRPILAANCFACHGPDSAARQGDLRLDQREAAVEAAITPGQPEASELISRITSEAPEVRMPPVDSGKELTAEQIALLKRWIAAGARYQRHWSLLPPTRPKLPPVKQTGWSRNAIDRFVLARLDREGLRPSPPADRATLLRRASLDLIGLPPTPEEVEALLADDSPAAWEKTIDRLLDSSRFGEHLARPWLDAARYADTNGYQYDLKREQWVWRDWVIDALNDNMPFDQFTVEQIAGDLLPDATDRQRLATAFHRNHPITIEGGVIDEEYRTEYVMDRVVTTSTVWLGLTMTCGRCHDHKYDPISQREFYQFFAFFNQVPERGLNGFNPKLKAPSPLQAGPRQAAERLLQRAQADYEKRVAQHADRFETWSEQLRVEATDRWQVIVPAERRSAGGATLVVQPDNSILATGKNPPVETYELIFPCDRPIHALRIEALTHESFVGGGTGRGSNGNFVLSELEVQAASSKDGDDFQPVPIASAAADYQQQNYPIAAAIDGRIDRTGWAVDGNTKQEDRVAWFTLEQPLLPEKTARVRLRMHHRWGGSHHIGRFRLALATRPVHTVPADIAGIAETKPDRRSRPQSATLQQYLAERFGSPALRAAAARLQAARASVNQLTSVPATMVLQDQPHLRKTHVLFRGEYDKPREEVTAGTPAALPPLPPDAPRNRLGLARWLVQPDHPLTARVAVNRMWRQLFGTGLVKTAEDFGTQGDLPSHPELLDWLAVEFVESGWNVKRLLKLIVTSSAYQQSSRVTPELQQRDPDNRLLARGPRVRLDAEVIRDSALHAAGLLTHRLGGPSVFPYHPRGLWQEINNRPGYSRTYQQDSGANLYRRSLYTFWKRTVPPPSMAAFDAPEREFCVVRRSRTNTPLQALVLLHDPQFVEAARHLGRRMMAGEGDVDRRLTYGFRICFARQPSAEERSALRELHAQQLARYRDDEAAALQLLSVGESPRDETLDPARHAAWTGVARSLMNLSEFVTKP